MTVVRRPRPTAHRGDLAAAAILLAFLALASTYSIVTPIFEGYDENWHYAYVQHIATGKGLPRQPPDQYGHLARQEASQPPLYYLLAAAVTWWIPQDDLPAYLRSNPQFSPVPWGTRDNQNVTVHTDAERFPYRGAVLAVHLSRAVSILLGAATVACTYALARKLFPGARVLAYGAMLATALTPGFLFTSALVNNDILVAFLCSLTLVLLARIWRSAASVAMGSSLGVALGCAALTKLSGLLLWVFAGLVLAAIAWRKRDPRLVTRVALPAFGLAILISAWWYVRNWTLYGDVTGLNMMLDIVGRRDPGFGLRDVWSELEGIRWSYWALFGWFNVPVASWLYRAYDLLSLAGLAGLVVACVRWTRQKAWAQLGAAAALIAWLVVSFVGLVRWTLTTVGSQGRLLYPAISAISILLVSGWLALLPRRRAVQAGAMAGLGLAFLAVAVYAPFWVIRPAYARPAVLDPEHVAAQVSTEAQVTFEDQATLLGVQVDRQAVAPGDLLWVKVCWQGHRAMETDDFVFVQLLVENDLIAAQKDTYHGLGTFPTSLWPPGVAFCDEYPLRVSDTVPSPGPAVLCIGLYGPTGQRLAVVDASGQPLADQVRLPGPPIVFPEAGRTLDYEWGHQIALVDYRLEQTATAPGGSLHITLAWQALARIPSDYSATVQVLDAQGVKIGQSDMLLPTSTWQVMASPVPDQRVIEIAPDAAAGVYQIKVAVYEPATVKNLALYRRGQRLPGGGLLDLWTLRVRSD